MPSTVATSAGSAHLSWDEHLLVTDRVSSILQPTPLYLLLEGIEDVQALGVELRWSPRSISGPAYFLWPDTSLRTGCGTASHVLPVGGLGGDSTFTWSIRFEPGSARMCVTYLVWGDNEPAQPATFCLASVKVMDSSGEIHELEIAGGATLFGGAEESCPLAVTSIYPSIVQAGAGATLQVSGVGFDSGSQVEMVVDGDELPAASVTLLSGSRLSADFVVPGDFVGSADVIVTSGSGQADTLSQELELIAPPLPYHPTTVIASFRPEAVASPRMTGRVSLDQVSFVPAGVSAMLSGLGVDSLTLLTPELAAAGVDSSMSPPAAPPIVYLLELADTNVVATVEALNADTGSVLSADLYSVGTFCSSPDDPRYSQQWWLNNRGPVQFPGAVAGKDCKAEGAWAVYPGGQSRVIVIDSGTSPSNPDLAGRLTLGPGFCTNCLGEDSYTDVMGHGTAVCGMIGAAGNNGQLVVGVNWDAEIESIKIGHYGSLGADGFLTSDLISALDYVTSNPFNAGAIVCLALKVGDGNSASHFALHQMVREAWRKSMLVVTATGNSGVFPKPAVFAPYTFAVGAMDFFGAPWSDNHFDWENVYYGIPPTPTGGTTAGKFVRMVGPGGRFIQTTGTPSQDDLQTFRYSSGLYGFGGTSAGAAAIAGGASLLQAHLRSLGLDPTGEDLGEILVRTATQYGSSPWDSIWGAGCLNLEAAIKLVSAGPMLRHFVADQAAVDSVVDLSSITSATVLNWPPLIDGTYTNVHRIAVRDSVTFDTPYVTPPVVWPRLVGMVGAGDLVNPINALDPNVRPYFARVLNVSTTGASLRTYVYTMDKGGSTYYWPADWSDTGCLLTAVGIPVSLLDVAAGGEVRPLRFGCMPSPARSEVALRVDSSLPGHAKVEVFDVCGARMAVVHGGWLSAGSHDLRWGLESTGSSRVPAGVYFARLKFGAETRMARFAVLE